MMEAGRKPASLGTSETPTSGPPVSAALKRRAEQTGGQVVSANGLRVGMTVRRNEDGQMFRCVMIDDAGAVIAPVLSGNRRERRAELAKMKRGK